MELDESEEFYYMIPDDIEEKERCVCFDFDGTLVTRKNGSAPYVQETVEDNFVIFPGVVDSIISLIEENILVVIISNQSNFTEIKKREFESFNELFDNNLCILIAHKKNNYRKPNPGFADLLSGLDICFYCGDAANSDHDFVPYTWDKNQTDYVYAETLGVPFYTPHDVFEFNYLSYEPSEDIVIMMGVPGSGKTSISKRFEEENGYLRFSQDELKKLNNPEMTVSALNSVKNKKYFTKLLNSGEKIILDATHGNPKNRNVWVDFANNLGKSYVIVWSIRDGRPFNNLRTKKVNPAVYSQYSSTFESPENENFVIVA